MVAGKGRSGYVRTTVSPSWAHRKTTFPSLPCKVSSGHVITLLSQRWQWYKPLAGLALQKWSSSSIFPWQSVFGGHTSKQKRATQICQTLHEREIFTMWNHWDSGFVTAAAQIQWTAHFWSPPLQPVHSLHCSQRAETQTNPPCSKHLNSFQCSEGKSSNNSLKCMIWPYPPLQPYTTHALKLTTWAFFHPFVFAMFPPTSGHLLIVHSAWRALPFFA